MQTVKFDVNIEKDMAYALKVKECPQLLFLRGHKIMYREKGNVFVLFLVNGNLCHSYRKHRLLEWIFDLLKDRSSLYILYVFNFCQLRVQIGINPRLQINLLAITIDLPSTNRSEDLLRKETATFCAASPSLNKS